MSVGTGLTIGREASPELVRRAVNEAMEKAELRVANSVLLFLTSEFARDLQPALKAAGIAASCVQIVGCSAPGIFTEEDWVLDAPAAAAMVFGDGIALTPGRAPHSDQLLLSMVAPSAVNITWLTPPGLRFGGISGDAAGQGPFSVWHNGKGAAEGYCEVALHGAAGAVGVAHGVRVLSEPRPVSASQGYDIIFLGGKPALDTLQRAYPKSEPLPLHRIMAGIADSAEAFKHGNYRLAPLVCANEADRSVTLACRLEPEQLVFWALREADAAQADFDAMLTSLTDSLDAPPQFGLMFSCLGRGPYFYSGADYDLELLQKRFPGMPLIGFYGNGEIAPIGGVNELLQHSAVLGLFHGIV